MSHDLTCRAQLPRLFVLVCLLLASALAGTALAQETPAGAAPRAAARGPLILVSIDGFRPDYLARGITPHLAALAAAGVQAEGMRPAFPSLTFPNHYTLVTGLYPDHHGIVHNRIESEDGTSVFIYKDAATTADPRWWGGEPVWVGAERQGVRAATMFWPGSDGIIGGLRPSYWKAYDRNFSAQARVDTVLGWLDLPAAQRPGFITLYFEQADRAGHDYGPDSAEVGSELARIDAALGRLLDGLAARGLREQTNLVVVSDHGLMAAARERVIRMDEIVDLQQVRPVNYGVLAGFVPLPGQERQAQRLLKRHAHMQCWRRAQIPERFRYGHNARVPPIVCLAEPGWVISHKAWLDDHADDFPRGEHGYDNDLAEMRALFIAQGPAFRSAARIGVFNNVDVYNLLMQVLGLKAAPNDGDTATLQQILRDPH